MATLAPPTTSKTMNSPSSSSSSSDAVSDSGHSSPDSSNVGSPLVSFDHPLDPLNLYIDSGATSNRSGSTCDSSADDSLVSSISPSSHDSPAGDWSASGTGPTKESTDPLWNQHDLSLFSLDSFSSSGGMDFPLGFDSMLFANDPLFSMNSTSNGTVPADLSSFTFNFGTEAAPNVNIQPMDVNARRSSTTSSSSGLSASPVSELTHAGSSSMGGAHASFSASSIVYNQAQNSNDELMDELAVRARQLVGLTMALPFGASMSAHSVKEESQPQQAQPEQSAGIANPSLSVQASTVPSLSAESGSSTPAPVPTTSRTKTSHTTIERRYRTNLNARIQALRSAVPALRVLEVKQGNRVGNLSLKAGTRRVGVDPDAKPGQEDVIDERGYIDGVKVARKGSKANVLGKAVEYIHVLKRRETRLKREQDGLKALIRSLVGGPELVQQWEKMWRERFGGPEKDEISSDDADADDENDDCEDDDDVDDKESDEAGTLGRKRKRTKVDSAKGKEKKADECESSNYPPAMQPVPIMPSQAFASSMSSVPISVPLQPEKRKRGRPRKVPLPSITMPNGVIQNTLEGSVASQSFQRQQVASVAMEVDPATNMQGDLQPASQSRQPSQQYLLAAFAFFSFFNSPLPYSSTSSWSTPWRPTHSHKHSGSVVGDPRPEVAGWNSAGTTRLDFGWRDAVQVTHLAISILLLLSIVMPWFPHLAKRVPNALKPMLGVSFQSDSVRALGTSSDDQFANAGEKADSEMRMVLLSALSRGRGLSPELETEVLREAIGLGTGLFGSILSLMRQMSLPSKSRSRYGLERRMLEQKAFLRFAELVALDTNASLATRLQTYLHAFKFLSIFSAPVKDISTLALVIHPLWRSKSASLWALARSRSQGKGVAAPHVCKAHETYVLESMTVDDAAKKIADLREGLMMRPKRNVDNTCADNSADEADVELEPAGPLVILAKQTIRDIIRRRAECVFLQSVTGDPCSDGGDNEDQDVLEHEILRVVEVGRSLDTRTAKLADAFERVCNPTSPCFASDSRLDFQDLGLDPAGTSCDLVDADAEVFALLHAIVLYRRIFPSTLLNSTAGTDPSAACRGQGPSSGISVSLAPMPSPPPSPSRRDAALHLSLRRCLDSSAFDRGDALEDARDRIVDMLTAESSAWPNRLRY